MFAEVVSQQNPVILNLRRHPDSEQVTVETWGSTGIHLPEEPQIPVLHRRHPDTAHDLEADTRTVEICPRGREGTVQILSRTPHTQCPRGTPSCLRATLAARCPAPLDNASAPPAHLSWRLPGNGHAHWCGQRTGNIAHLVEHNTFAVSTWNSAEHTKTRDKP